MSLCVCTLIVMSSTCFLVTLRAILFYAKITLAVSCISNRQLCFLCFTSHLNVHMSESMPGFPFRRRPNVFLLSVHVKLNRDFIFMVYSLSVHLIVKRSQTSGPWRSHYFKFQANGIDRLKCFTGSFFVSRPLYLIPPQFWVVLLIHMFAFRKMYYVHWK